MLSLLWPGFNPLVGELRFPQAVPLSQKEKKRKTSNKANVTLSSATFYLYMHEKCYTFKGQSLENGLSCIFQTVGNILNL